MSKASIHNDLWITEDGTYGTISVLLLDTGRWTDSDWDEFEDADENDKWYIAETVTKRHEKE